MHQTGNKNRKIYFQFTVLFLIIGFFTFFWFLCHRKTLILSTDGFDQYISIVKNIRSACQKLLTGGGVAAWNWSIGLGADEIASFYSILMDPFTYVMACFPVKWLDIGYGAAVYLRMYAAGLSMLFFLKSRKMEQAQCLIGALSYCYSMWVMVAFRQMIFLLPMILFPFLIYAIDRIDEGGNPGWMIFVTAAILISNLYFAYMAAIIGGIYFIIRYFTEFPQKKFVSFMTRLLHMLGYIFLAVLIAAPVILLVAYAIIHVPKTDESELTLFYTVRQLFLFIPCFWDDQQFCGNYSGIGICAVIAAMVPAFFLNLKKRKCRLPILLFFICMIILLFPVLGSVMNGFSYTSARWAYMYVFFLVWSGCECMDPAAFTEKSYLRKYIRGFVIFLAFSMAMVIGAEHLDYLASGPLCIIMVNFLTAVLTVYILTGRPGTAGTAWPQNRKLLLVCVVNLCLVMLIRFPESTVGSYEEYMKVGEAAATYAKSVLKNIKEAVSDTDFYRVDQVEHVDPDTKNYYISKYHRACNEPLYYDVPTNYSYISTMDASWYDFNRALCNNNGYVTRVQCYANDGRSRMNFLEGVRYFVCTDESMVSYCSYGYSEEETDPDEGVILKSNADTSLGYVYSDTISESEFLTLNYPDREQALMQAAVVADDYSGSAASVTADDLISDTEDLPYTVTCSNGIMVEDGKITVTEEDAVLTLHFDSIENSELYVAFNGLVRIPVSSAEYRKENLEQISSILGKCRFLVKSLSYRPEENFEMYFKKGSVSKRIKNDSGVTNQAMSGVTDFMGNLGYYENADGTVEIRFCTVGTYTYDALHVYAVSEENFDSQAEKLSSNRLQITEMGNDYVRGRVNSEGGILYLSILQVPGWSVYIDGEKTETFCVNLSFTGVEVTPGEHTVELYYRPLGWPYTLVLSGAGILAGLAIAIFHKRRRKVTEEQRFLYCTEGGRRIEKSIDCNRTV